MNAKKMPPLNWLRTFEASARHLNFSKAAEELNVTQSAVSQHIKLLEHFLKQELFVRSNRSLRLTDKGKLYLPIVTQAFSILEVSTDEFFNDAKNVVNCYCDISFSNCFLAPRLKQFKALHPDIEIRIQNSVWWQRRQKATIANHIDIRFGLGDWPDPSIRLSDNKVYPVMSKNHTLDWPIKHEHLKDIPLYQLLGVRFNWQQWLDKVGITEEMDLSVKTDSTVTNIELVHQGNGMTLMQNILASFYVKNGSLIKPFTQEIISEEGFYLVGDDKFLNTNEKLFVEWLLKESENI